MRAHVTRRLSRHDGQTAAEYVGVLAVVAAIIAALVVTAPGIGDLISGGIRSAVCAIAGDCGDPTPVAGADPAAAGGEADGPAGPGRGGGPGTGEGDGDGGGGAADGGVGGDGSGQGADDGDDGGLLDSLGPVGDVLSGAGDVLASGGRQVRQLAEGAGSQIWDEVTGLGELAAWGWRSATSAEQRRENGEIWRTVREDPLGAARTVWDGIYQPIAQEFRDGRPAAGVGRGVTAVATTIFGGKGVQNLRRLAPDGSDLRRIAPDAGDARRGTPDGTDARRADRGHVDCLTNSFVGATGVRMADGTTRRIDEVRVGDLVWAADPQTGEAGSRPVTRLIEGTGTRDLVDVVGADGALVTATAGHPFFEVRSKRWTDAGDLRPGDLLRTASGGTHAVAGVRTRTVEARVHNLTVADLHTFHVRVAAVDVLVHNQSGPCARGQFAVDANGLDDLARVRADRGLPPAGSAADRSTLARLDVDGQTYYGQNAHGRQVDGPVNAQTRTHAEADVFQQAVDSGRRADSAVLYVDRELCRACGQAGGVGSLMRNAGVEELVVVTPSGRYLITAQRPSVPIPLSD